MHRIIMSASPASHDCISSPGRKRFVPRCDDGDLAMCALLPGPM